MKRGQAAMEFLMTYGWAILVVLIAIAALAYFGVLNPSKFLPNSCTIAPGIGCDEFKIETASAQLLLRNGMGRDLYNVTVEVAGCTESLEADGNATWIDGYVLGGDDGITLVCSDNGAVDDRFKQDIDVTYTPRGGLTHTKTGSVTARIE